MLEQRAPGDPADTGHVHPVGPGPGSRGLWARWPELPELHKPVLTQRRQSPPAPSPPRTSGQLQSEPDWGAELG